MDWGSFILGLTCGGTAGIVLAAGVTAAGRRATFLPPDPDDGVQDDFAASARRWGHLRDQRRGG